MLNLQSVSSTKSQPLLDLPKLRRSARSPLSFCEQLHRQTQLQVFRIILRQCNANNRHIYFEPHNFHH